MAPLPRYGARQTEGFDVARLIYIVIASLDGYIADEDGTFDWAAPDEEVHAFVNDLLRPAGTLLYGRRMYDVMAVWETLDVAPEQSAAVRDFAGIWRGADKVVYSRTLDETRSARTRIERDFDPDVVRRMKASADRDLAIGGSGLAARAIGAGLVDEYHLVLAPVIVGGGTPVLPARVRLPLALCDERRFANGMVYLHYRAAG